MKRCNLFIAPLFFIMAISSRSAHAQAVDAQITGPPGFGARQIRVDLDSATAGYQVARRVPPGPFTIDIMIFNLPQPTTTAFLNVVFDPTVVSFVGIVPPGLLGSDPNPQAALNGNSVFIELQQGPANPCPLPGVTGSGLMARLSFNALMPDRAAGFDVTPALPWTGPPNCQTVIPPADYSMASAVMMIGDPTLSCLNVTTPADLPSVNPVLMTPDCEPALGMAQISLRSAIQVANAAPGGNHPTVRMPFPNPAIPILSPLPALNDPSGGTFIDGSTQLLGMPEVKYTGAAGLEGGTPTFELDSDNNTIKGLAIVGNMVGAGVYMSGGGNKVIGCRIGVEVSDAVNPNVNGVVIAGGAGNQVGGAGAGEGNLISGNSPGAGVMISGGSGALVQGNKIGTDSAGTGAMANSGNGIVINGGSGAVVGGLATNSQNLISGNIGSGILITAGSANTVVQKNRIGTTAAGDNPLPNGSGVRIENCPGNTIGGTAAGAMNIISGNNVGSGVEIIGQQSQNNVVIGNYIGIDVFGINALGNATAGVYIGDAPNNTIGSAMLNPANVISTNGQFGVQITGPNASNNSVIGNFIGTDNSGAASRGNGFDGVSIVDGSNNTIGGPASGERNVISGNERHGVAISGDSATLNLVRGNKIGVDVGGMTQLGNGSDGVNISGGAHDNTIGGSASSDRNQISSNVSQGVHLSGEETANNLIRANYIGVDSAGAAQLSNGQNGIFIDDASNNVIGGFLPAEGNLISGNTDNGVLISGQDSTGNILLNNLIGVTANGNAALGNVNDGVQITINARLNQIGAPNAGNVCSANGQMGVEISAAANFNAVLGNAIGTNLARTAALPNVVGVLVQGGAQSNYVGGDLSGQANVISGNDFDGVLLYGDATRFNVVRSNFIGTNAAAEVALPNGTGIVSGDGVAIDARASENTVRENVIVANVGFGVRIRKSFTDSNEIILNNIGMPGLPNQAGGVLIEQGAKNNGVGENIIDGNYAQGVLLDGLGTEGNVVAGNSIVANKGVGVMINNEATINFVGIIGSGPSDGNGIANNGGDGVLLLSQGNFVLANTIFENGGDGVRVSFAANKLSRNLMHDNVLLGIDLTPQDGVSPNDPGDPDGGGNLGQNFPVLTSAAPGRSGTSISGSLNSAPSTNYTLEFFFSPDCDPSGYGEGEDYLGSSTVFTDANGNVTFALTVSGRVTQAGDVTATATDPLGNTSEFSPCMLVGPPPPSCSADIAPPGGNGVVNVDDLLLVINSWGMCPVALGSCPADIAPPGGNGMVNVDDLLLVINSWGPCP